jgi:hypothetical protein
MVVTAGLSAACGADAYETTAYLRRAELHVDPARPDELARPVFFVDLLGGDEGSYTRIDGAWASPDTREPASLRLHLALEQSPVFVPADAVLTMALVNTGLRNGDVAAYCQSVMPMQLYFGFPGDPDRTAATFDDLAIFCP